MKRIKVHEVEDHLSEQIEKFNRISFIEYFIKQAHQFGILDEKRTCKVRDRKIAFVNHSTNEWVFIKGDLKTKFKLNITQQEK